MTHAGGRRPREAADVHLVDDRFLDRAVQRPVALPVVRARIDDGAAQRGGLVVAWTDRIGTLPQRLGDAAGVRADQHFVRVEAQPVPRIVRAVHAKGVVHAGPAPADEHVPEVEGLVPKRIESDDLRGVRRRRGVEQQQHHLGGRLREQREVDAVWIDRRPDRMCRACVDREHHRLPRATRRPCPCGDCVCRLSGHHRPARSRSASPTATRSSRYGSRTIRQSFPRSIVGRDAAAKGSHVGSSA